MQLWVLFAALTTASAQVLTPSQITISHNKPIRASATCGEINGQSINEVYCSLAGSTQYTPINQYSYSENQQLTQSALQELRNPRELFIQGGHGCGHCMAGTVNAHPAEFMVDGNTSWWQSPPLSRGVEHNEVNITIDLEQEFHVAYVWIQMANSPRPGSWILERSVDHGKTFTPWFYFAENNAECMRRFGPETLAPLDEDDQIICRTDMASIQPLENAEMVINLLEHRPSRTKFATSSSLQNFTRATNVRIRLLGTRTLQGHLMDLSKLRADPTVTRRYFYSIKEIHMGGRCVCNGHASTCDVLDYRRPKTLLCRCEHGTCGDMCEKCCPGFEQKPWQKTTAANNFTCEPCNCFGRSDECVYEEQLDKAGLSLDIHGNYAGGGRCLNCRDNTEGINCNTCSFGFYKPEGVYWNDTNPCRPCLCDPAKHTGACAADTGMCECQARFEGENCDRCAAGYYDPPECKACDCSVKGTLNETCLPIDGQCPCLDGFGGQFCETCAPGFTNVTAGCVGCQCNEVGALNSNCSAATGQCACKSEFSGLACDECAQGYYGFPNCTYCNCDDSGTENGMCDPNSGQCLCKPGFAGERCDQCDTAHWGYPNCMPCACDGAGAKSIECDIKTGDCPCSVNFTGSACDKCAAGFYDYPNCKACSCLIEGALGQTCDNSGQCYCKGNFEGERCDHCKPNFYNFPTCEECNCHPSGVTPNFAGCDKVAPGELCSCRAHVTGRICDQCKPTFWDLQYHHPDGCIGCDCNLAGTLSMLNSCDQNNGQCVCKRHVGGRGCDKCAEGYFNMKSYNQLGCEPCNCDLGGSLRGDCDGATGQCKCKPRVAGKKCDRPIENHYFPTLWHNMYEAEDGHTPDNRPVRFAIDANQFANFSWRGYAVFSPIQEKIILDVDIAKSSVYRILLRYHNPTSVPITALVAMAPTWTNTHDNEQSLKIVLPPTTEPQTFEVTGSGKPFLMNPGKWKLSVSTKQRLFLDYVVILPQEYYEGSILKERMPSPCKANDNGTCLDLLYPPIRVAAARVDATAEKMPFNEVADDGQERELNKVPIEILPAIIGPAAFVRADNKSRMIKAELDVPSENDYVILIEYHNQEETDLPIQVQLLQNGEQKLDGTAIIHHCPYAVFCRELVTAGGNVPEVHLMPGKAEIQFNVEPMHEFGLASVSLIPKDQWNHDFLQQYPVCTRKNGVCFAQQYPPAQNEITTQAETENEGETIKGDSLPFNVANPNNVNVVPLDVTDVDINGIVPQRGHYMFIVNYFNPDHTPMNIDAWLSPNNNDVHYKATVPLEYCPSYSGCRALITEKDRPSIIQFWLEDKYTVKFSPNPENKVVYIDSITTVPYNSYTEQLMKLQPIDLSSEFVKECLDNFFENPTCNVTDFCREKIFSLTADFNQAALSCDCVAAGSSSFACEKYGGQCQCKANVIGRRCDRCAPGYYNYPECTKCKCGANQQCDERTGQCFCAPHVEGQQCDKCVPQAFGYDPLIGCQLCGCNSHGSEGGALQCDPLSGQCLCKEDVGGRQCERCLPGNYGFPHCYPCRCNRDGTTEDICDATSAQCSCKESVEGPMCDQCKIGTFDLSPSNPDGCVSCFCFGVTDRCRSSHFPVAIMGADIESFTASDLNGNVTVVDDVVTFFAGADGSTTDVYFSVPNVGGRDFTSSYGLNMHIKLSCTAGESKRINTAADLRLLGRNMTFEYINPEQPHDPSKPFDVNVKLVPENFMFLDGKSVTRSDLMMMLYSLENITIKGSYYENPKIVELIEFGLEISGEKFGEDLTMTASSVERCECPAPYTGPSCQECASGFYRVKTGPYLGSCVPCDCHGHSGTCDPDTGVCSNCEHNTFGEHCEFCDEGFYGDATSGSPYSCTACSCPFAPTNNFATSCEASPFGEMLSCNCKPGYAGTTCERCDSGFFGDPQYPGGTCSPCSCNGNNNLTDPRSCHPISGDCYLCEKSTAGRHCEWCAPWYHGDAIEAKDCTECTCDKCGSENCDNKNGTCACKPNVEGDNCDKCAPDHFGFKKCNGCSPCHCGTASSTTQCHEETGQCACRPGAAGLRCEHCEHGFWNYGPNGCQKCDCEADLSMGTVCDVRTGQCHCQEGATGPRCDQCLPSYLRIPTYGCRRCDECVHHLKDDVDALDISIGILGGAIGNISASTVAGARLSRANKTLTNIQEVAELIETFKNDDHSSFFGGAKAVLTNVTATTSSANRTQEVLINDLERVQNITAKAEEVLSDIRDRVEVSTWVVDDMKNLASSIGSEAKAFEVKPEWTEEAQLILETLQNVTHAEKPKEITEIPTKIDLLTVKVQELRNKDDAHNKKIEARNAKISEAKDYVEAAKQQLLSTSKMTKHAVAKAKDLSFFHLESLNNGISSDAEKAKDALHNVSTIIREANEALNELKENIEFIMERGARLNESRQTLSEVKFPGDKRVRRGAEEQDLLNKMKTKSSELSAQASKLNGTFGEARLASQNAVEAANAYEGLVKTLQSAKETAENTAALITDDSDTLVNLKIKVATVEEESKNLKKKADELSKDAADYTLTEMADAQRHADAVTDSINQMKTRKDNIVKNLQQSFNSSQIEDANKAVVALQEKNDELKMSFETTKEEAEKYGANAAQAAQEATKTQQGLKQTKKNADSLAILVPKVVKRFDDSVQLRGNKTARVTGLSETIEALKEKIAIARDAANRIRLGAHFEQGSSLDLSIPDRVRRSAAYTDVAFHFRTHQDNGIPLFLGNEEGSAGTRAVPTDDYIAVEIEQGKPKVSVNLGNGPTQIKLDTSVNDNQWRKINVERIGKSATVTLSEVNSDTVAETKSAVIEGNKSVLNLHQTISKLFVGGVPKRSRLARDIRNQDFVGDVEDLELHGVPVGLWNAKERGVVNVKGAVKRPRSTDGAYETGVSLDGDGYIIYKMGSWNPRQKTNFQLKFLTYSPDGLLFFIGLERDFLSLELSNGYPKLSVDLGNGVGTLESDQKPLNDGKWHTITIHRLDKHMVMEIDGEKTAEDDVPGSMSELSISDYFYVGGVPSGINSRNPAEPIKGCIKEVQLDTEFIDLQSAHASKGVRNACTASVVREISIDNDHSTAKFTGIAVNEVLEFTLKFKSVETHGSLFSITTDEEDQILTVDFASGQLTAKVNGNEKVEIELASAADGQWHYVTVRRDKTILRMDVDDLYSKLISRTSAESDHHSEDKGVITFGKQSVGSFIGCLGDVTFNGKLLDFAQSTWNGVHLTGCSMPADLIVSTIAPEKSLTTVAPPETTSSQKSVELPTDYDLPTTTEEPVETTTTTTTEEPTTTTTEKTKTVREEGSCMLYKTPLGERPDSDGTRYGLNPGSRLEFETAPDAFDKSGTFSLQLRATATNGIILFATDRKDHLGIFLMDGKVQFSFNTGSGQVTIRSNVSVLDDEWHTVKASRSGNGGTLQVDEEVVESPAGDKDSSGTDSVDTMAPIYIGGIPNELASFARNIVPGIKTEFSGCLRDLKLNDKKFDGASKSVGTVPCSQFVENGMFFGHAGGYAILHKEFQVGSTFSAELDVRPRSSTGVLLSVGVLEYVTVQMVDGTVKFTVDSGSGPETLSFVPTAKNSLCDGHWHNIKVNKKKHLMTLTVDGKSNLTIMKKGKKSDTVTKDPIYLGGVPEGTTQKGLEIMDSFVGCVRIVNFGGKKDKERKRKQLDISAIETFGDVNKMECPVN